MASLLTNLTISVNGKKGAKLTSVKDFLFDWDVESAKNKGTQTPEEMKMVFEQIAAAGRLSAKNKDRDKLRKTHKPASQLRESKK